MLNEHQRRRLAVRLGRLVEEAEEFLGRLEEAPPVETLSAADARPAVDARPAAHAAPAADDAARMESLERELAEIATAARSAAEAIGLPLDADSPDLRHRVQAWSAAWWTRMLDCRPEKLRGLGEVDPEDAARIGPAVEAIAARLSKLQRMAGED